MKAKNILMTLLLVAGAIAAKASGYPPELALVSQPVMVYNHSSITVYYDVENIGDYTYKGDVYIFLEPDFGYYYAREYVKVYPGRIKRIAIDIPARSFDLYRTFTIMPYYELGNELYSFTTFEYFEPVRFYWHGPRTEPWVVIHIGPRPRYYHRPGTYRYYYDGYRPPMHGRGPGMPPPMDPMHHTYGYHHSIGGYPATHPEWSNNGEMPKPTSDVAPSATIRPKENAGSMSGSSSTGNTSAATGARPSTNSRPEGTGSSSGSINRPSSNGSASGSVSRPSSNSSTSRPSSASNVSGSSTRPATNGSASRPSTSASSSSRPSGNSSSSVSRPSGSTSRPSGNSSSNMSGSSSRTSNSSSARTSSSSSSTRSCGTSSTKSSSSSSSSRSGASTSSATGSGRR